MIRRFALTAASIALFAAAARAAIDVEVRNGDQVTATIAAASDVETIRFRVPTDAVISVKAKSAKRGPALHVVLKDADGAPTGGGPKDGRSATFARVVATKSGTYSVEVSAQDGVATGDFTVSVTWKSPSAYVFPLSVSPATTMPLGFSADAGAVATFSVKRPTKSSATPVLTELNHPDASKEPLSGTSTRKTLDATGDWEFSLSGGPDGGAVVAAVKLKSPKPSRRKLALTSSTIGSGGSGDYAHASVVVPGGGTVTVPSIGDGQPGSQISGSSVTIPPGALPAGTSIVIATAPSIATPSGAQSAGPSVFFGPEGVRFDTVDSTKRARVTIPFDTSFAGDPTALQIYTRDARGRVTLVPQPPAYVVDLVAGTMTFETSHFSSFCAAAPSGVQPKPDFFTIASIADPEDVCDAFDPNAASPSHLVFYVAEGDAKTVGAMRIPTAGTQLVRETWAGGGTQTADGTFRTQFQFVDPVRTVFSVQGGSVYVGTTTQIFRIAPQTGLVVRVAGTGQTGDTGDDGSALSATFTSIRNVIADLNGNLFVADDGAHRIRSIDAQSSFAIFPWAGTGAVGVGADGGNPSQTSFVGPSDMIFSRSGGLYVADGARIRLIQNGQTPVNVTVAGDPFGESGSGGDGAKPSSAQFQHISGISQYIDPQNPNGDALLVADSADHVVRLVDFTGSIVKLVAGAHGTSEFNGDSGFVPGVLNGPVSVLAGPGQAIICDHGNARLRTALIK